MKNMLKLGLILATWSAIACVALAGVYAVTSGIIDERAKSDLEAALKEVFPDATVFDDVSDKISSADPRIAFLGSYLARQGEGYLGVAIKAKGPSYGGATTLLAGIGIDRRISAVKILENKDTAGLGANAANPGYFVDKAKKLTFYGQFSGKPIGDAFEPKKDIVAITASTITSRAIASIVKAAGSASEGYLASIVQGGAK
jgi:electron transport complex protein RnfG